MTIDEVRNYQQIRTPDYARLASLVSQAKGPDRTMAQFAEVTGIGASTLSRLVNLNIKKPLSIEVIIKIYECRANEEDTYLLDALARANGFYPDDYAQRVKSHDSIVARRNAQINREYQMKNALVAGVAAAGCNITVIPRPRLSPDEPAALYMTQLGDFMLRFGDSENTSGKKDWSFFLHSRTLDDGDSPSMNAKYFARRFFQFHSEVFLMDAWSPEALRGLKISFAFVDKDILGEFWNAVCRANIHNEMSLILIDPISYRVLDEIWIPGDYSPMSNINVFRVPASTEEDLYEEEEIHYEDDPE